MAEIISTINFRNEKILRYIKDYQTSGILPRYIAKNEFMRAHNTIKELLQDWLSKVPAEYHPILDKMFADYFKDNNPEQKNAEERLAMGTDITTMIDRLNIKKVKFRTPTIKPDKHHNSELLTLLEKISEIYKKILKRQNLNQFDIFTVKLLKEHYEICIKAITDDMLAMDKIFAIHTSDNIAKSKEMVLLRNIRGTFETMLHLLPKVQRFFQDKLFQ